MLLPEEIRRTIEYYEWKATWWEERAAVRSPLDPALREGLSAYAARQANVRRGLAASVKSQWLKTKATVSPVYGGDVPVPPTLNDAANTPLAVDE